MAPNGSITKSWSIADSKKAKSERASAGSWIHRSLLAPLHRSPRSDLTATARHADAIDLGEKDLDVRPIRYGRAQLEHDGRTEVGQVEQIDPLPIGRRLGRFRRCWWRGGGDEDGAATSVVGYATCKGSSFAPVAQRAAIHSQPTAPAPPAARRDRRVGCRSRPRRGYRPACGSECDRRCANRRRALPSLSSRCARGRNPQEHTTMPWPPMIR
jgi:hypothetical protein